MRAVILAAMCLAATPAGAQRAAISADLSPQAVASVFINTTINVCTATVAGGQRISPALASAHGLTQTRDSAVFRQIGAPPDDAVWDVAGAQGVVFVDERADRCTVSAYGPPAGATLAALAQRLAGEAGFERMAGTPGPSAFEEHLARTAGGRRIQVKLRGAEPGMPGHKSRFSMLTATVFVLPTG